MTDCAKKRNLMYIAIENGCIILPAIRSLSPYDNKKYLIGLTRQSGEENGAHRIIDRVENTPIIEMYL